MKLKWYFIALLGVFSVFGVFQNQAVAPNQEIVLQFANADVASAEAKNTIAIVKERLLSIGIYNTKVVIENGGKLKITYHSNYNIAVIKRLLVKAHKISFKNPIKTLLGAPSEKYNLNVYKIEKETDSKSGLNGKFLTQSKQGLDSYANPDLQVYTSIVSTKNRNILTKIALKINSSITIATDNTSYKIPEVRAGPNS